MKHIARSYKLQRFNPINFGLLAILLYSFAIHKYSFNFPYLDDYDAILRFLNHLTNRPHLEYISIIFDQHNEHRIVLAHIISALSLEIFGVVNFRMLIYFGHLAWLLVITIFWRYAQGRSIGLAEFVPVILVLLSFSHWEMMTWALTSIVQYWQVLFCLLSIYSLTNGRLIAAGIFCLLGVFSGGGAITLLPLFCLYFIAQKSWRTLVYFVAYFGVVLLTYFYFIPYIPPSANTLLMAIKQPLIFFAFLFGFLGGSMNFSFIGPASFIGSGILIFGLLIKKFHSIYDKNDFLTWVIIFILMYGLLGALNRSYLGISAGGISYYSVYSLILICCIYLKYLIIISSSAGRLRVRIFGTLFGMLLFSYWSWKAPIHLEDRHHLLSHGYIIHSDKVSAERVLEVSKAKKVFIAPVVPMK